MRLLGLSKQVEQKIIERKAKEKREFNSPVSLSRNLNYLNENISPDLKEVFEERAAIREFDGGQDHIKAENGAIKDIETKRFQDLNEGDQESLLDVFRTLLKWSKDLEGGTK